MAQRGFLATIIMDRRIESISDERENGGEFFVYLAPGYSFTNPPQHCFGAESKREIRETMKRVQKCECGECRSLVALES
jgi:hypothetical protein